MEKDPELTEMTRTLNSYYKNVQNAQGYKEKYEHNAERNGRHEAEVKC